MMATASETEDEFDAIPDFFGSLDWNTIPGLEDNSSTSTSETIVPNSSLGEISATAVPASPNASSDYSCDDDLDDTFIAEVDALEESLTQGTPKPICITQTNSVTEALPSSSLLLQTTAPLDPPAATPGTSRKEECQLDSARTEEHSSIPEGSQAARKHKNASPDSSREESPALKRAKFDPNEATGLRRVLEGFEDELTCPICFDIFVAPHLGIPCGHTFCGECGWDWISKNKRAPTCAVCRSPLAQGSFMAPVFTVESTVQKHVEALASSGFDEWAVGGEKRLEWEARKTKWKVIANKMHSENAISALRRGQRPSVAPLQVIEIPSPPDWLEIEDDYGDDSYEEDEEAGNGDEEEEEGIDEITLSAGILPLPPEAHGGSRGRGGRGHNRGGGQHQRGRGISSNESGRARGRRGGRPW